MSSGAGLPQTDSKILCRQSPRIRRGDTVEMIGFWHEDIDNLPIVFIFHKTGQEDDSLIGEINIQRLDKRPGTLRVVTAVQYQQGIPGEYFETGRPANSLKTGMHCLVRDQPPALSQRIDCC